MHCSVPTVDPDPNRGISSPPDYTANGDNNAGDGFMHGSVPTVDLDEDLADEWGEIPEDMQQAYKRKSSYKAAKAALGGKNTGLSLNELGPPHLSTDGDPPEITLNFMKLLLYLRIRGTRKDLISLFKDYEISLDENYNTQELAEIHRKKMIIVAAHQRGYCDCAGASSSCHYPSSSENNLDCWEHLSKRAFIAFRGVDVFNEFEYEFGKYFVSRQGNLVRFDGDKPKLSKRRPNLQDGYVVDQIGNTKIVNGTETGVDIQLPRAYAVFFSFCRLDVYNTLWVIDHIDINPNNNHLANLFPLLESDNKKVRERRQRNNTTKINGAARRGFGNLFGVKDIV